MRLGELVEDHLGTELLLAGLRHLRAVLVVLEAALALEVLVHLVLDELRGHGDVDRGDERLDQLVAGGSSLHEHRLLGDALGEAVAQLRDRVELAGHLREVVVGVGQLALLDGGDVHRDLGLLAGVVAADELRAEGRVLAGSQRLDGLVDTLEELARADLVGHAFGAVDLGAVDRGDEVELDEVALGSGTVDRHERAEASAQAVQLGIHSGGVGLDRLDLDGHAGELGEVELGTHVDLDLDLEVAGEVLVARPVDDLGRRTADGADLVSRDGLAVEAVQTLADGVLDDGAATDALVDDRGGHLALAEAGDLDVLRDVLVRVRDRRLELVGGDRDVELDPGRAELLDGAGDHACSFSSCSVARGRVRFWVCGVRWSGRQDLNLRPPAPKAGALPS